MGETELSGIPFRFSTDLELVVHEKKLTSICEYLHYLSAAMGLAEFEMANHVLTQKQYPPVTGI
jgi:hypothetical protein